MELRQLDKALSWFIKEFSFISDPIFLFNPRDVPEKLDFSSWILELEYPLIDEILKNISNMKNGYETLISIFYKINFTNDFLKDQYKKRVEEIWLIIEIIECFYDKDETKKFDLITKYFWVDLDLCKNEILKNKQIISNEFDSLLSNSYLFDDVYHKIKDRLEEEINADQIKYYFEEALKFLKIEKYWEVEISDKVLSVVHWDFTENWGKIYIPKNRKIKLSYLFPLIIHEIDWHSKQFTNFWDIWLYKANIRFSKSEEILEWLAKYLEYSFDSLILKSNLYSVKIDDFQKKVLFLEWKISFEKFLVLYSMNLLRVFRWFSNIKNYFNTKDLIYIQWLYKIIKYKNIYWNDLFSKVYDWVINEDYILQNCKIIDRQFDIVEFIKNSSAFYVLNKFIS